MSKAHKPAPDHPWRRSCVLRREVNEYNQRARTLAVVNNYKVGGGRQPWNAR